MIATCATASSSRSRPAPRRSRSPEATPSRSPCGPPSGARCCRTSATSYNSVVEDGFSPADLPGEANEVGLALQWTALTPGRTADAILALNAASDFEEFRSAAIWFEVPSQNLLYADVDGHIGYQMPGKIPIRRAGEGTIPVTGWNTSYGWQGYIPFGQLPWTYDPPEQYIVTANQAVVDERLPVPADARLGVRLPQPAADRPDRGRPTH